MKSSIDVASRVSSELSAVIDGLVNDADREEPPTLSDLRHAVLHRMHFGAVHDRLMHPQEPSSMLDEVEELIAEFGPEAPALDFDRAKASEALSRIIEYATGYAGARRKPTLGTVREAMASGMIAELVGDGVIEPDEDQTLLAEIEGLIDRHGADALAEEFVRFE